VGIGAIWGFLSIELDSADSSEKSNNCELYYHNHEIRSYCSSRSYQRCHAR
jgi:hypothetical protein